MKYAGTKLWTGRSLGRREVEGWGGGKGKAGEEGNERLGRKINEVFRKVVACSQYVILHCVPCVCVDVCV